MPFTFELYYKTKLENNGLITTIITNARYR